MDAVATGLGAHIDHRIAFSGSFGVKNLIAPYQPQRKGVHQWILRVAGFKFGFAAQVGNSKTVSV